MSDDLQLITTAISMIPIKKIRTKRALELEAQQPAFPDQAQAGLPMVAPPMYPGVTYPAQPPQGYPSTPYQPAPEPAAQQQWAVPATPWNPQTQWPAPAGAGPVRNS